MREVSRTFFINIFVHRFQLSAMFIDTHSHIYEEEFREDREEAVQRAIQADVNCIILPDIDSQSRGRMLDLEARHPDIMRPLIGLHPTSVNENYKQELAEIEKNLGTHRFYGIGECGIDLYWDKTFYKEQIRVFEHQLGIAGDMNFPVIIHSRESLDEIFKVLKKHPYAKGILHCFSGNEEEAQQAFDMGFMLGIGGVVTFKNSRMARVIQHTGIDRIVLETDAPYLAPVPFRGKRNESSYIPIIAGKIAELTGENLETIAKTTTRNAQNLFSLPVIPNREKEYTQN